MAGQLLLPKGRIGMRNEIGVSRRRVLDLLKNTPLNRKKAAWLYAQFVVSKTVSLTKTLIGLTYS